LILYVNGDSHSTGAEAVNDYAFIMDDPKQHGYQDRWAAHPDNLKVCYGKVLADMIGYEMINQSRSAGSNDRVIRTTNEYLENNRPDLIVIGWSTWEREEWFAEGEWWQINASGVGNDWPEETKQKYKEYVIKLNWEQKAIDAHNKIVNLHYQFLDLKIPHLFFNTCSTFNYYRTLPRIEWGDYYIRPYDKWSYQTYLDDLGFSKSNWNHFRADGHKKWAEFLLPFVHKIL
jgi:hypothetical protein